MRSNTVTYEEQQILAEARKIIKRERTEKASRFFEKATQRFAGIALLAISAAVMAIMPDDCGICVITIPVGLWLLLSRRQIMY